MERLSWDQYFMAQSHLLASRSTCMRLVVGATIVRDKRIIAGGYNGSISGGVHCTDEGCYMIDGHCVRTIHAEMNAILQCAKFGEPTDGADIYVTHYPCIQCCKAIIQAGIRTVCYANDYKNHPYAEELFRMSGTEVRKVPLDPHVFRLNDPDLTKERRSYIDELIGHLETSGEDRAEIRRLRQEADRLFATER